jgi:tRNA-binding EMAP/Myf-like protein
MIKGIKSEGMLLAAIGKDKVSLVTIDRDISVGSDVA